MKLTGRLDSSSAENVKCYCAVLSILLFVYLDKGQNTTCMFDAQSTQNVKISMVLKREEPLRPLGVKDVLTMSEMPSFHGP
ncbi:hypothetical protein AV530_011990 [Patagioenas fasciata monilis]|uniref:Uncharacterized protein n=1 Tax=Patagioenas fasciata monilis TaxID=372326 RepID=A0A1V4JUG1_PATFA|nr:hypothetical protein AV530_011990 [Patagioenas fasciata monilis]